MLSYVNGSLTEASKSKQLPKILKNNAKINQYKVFPMKISVREGTHTPVGSSVRYISIDHTLSQSIGGLKEQINRLRTESPEMVHESPQRSLNQLRNNKIKKRNELARIILTKLKRQKSKEHARITRKNSSFLPCLDLEGHKYNKNKIPLEEKKQSPKRIKIQPQTPLVIQTVAPPTPEAPQSPKAPYNSYQQYNMDRVLKMNRSTKKKHEKMNSFPVQMSMENKPNHSISGWHRALTIQEECLLYDGN